MRENRIKKSYLELVKEIKPRDFLGGALTHDAMTLRITRMSIVTISKITFSITTIRITTLKITTN